MSNNNFSNLYNKPFTIARARTADAFADFQASSYSKHFKGINLKRNHAIAIGIFSAIVITFLVAFLAGRYLAPTDGNRLGVPKPIATQMLNRKFDFPLRDDAGKQVSTIGYEIQDANLQNSFLYQGKLATAVKGRTFLIVNLKITNPYSKTIQVNARDYIRVKANGSSEQLAPEIHNDPVEVQPKSTKYTRVGLPLNDTDKDIVLVVGELTGAKTPINLSLNH